jgi:hypothetical protein
MRKLSLLFAALLLCANAALTCAGFELDGMQQQQRQQQQQQQEQEQQQQQQQQQKQVELEAVAPVQLGLICDGQVRTLAVAQAPFPTSSPWTPMRTADAFTCSRPLQGTTRQCGSMAADTCEGLRFGPVLQSSGSTPGIIPPNNPLRFAVKAESAAYLTYVQFRAGGIGTAGARLRGLYGQSSPLQFDSSDYAWAKNGPVQLPGGFVVYDSCGDCRVGFGVQDLQVAALPGAGFRAFELSQLYMDTRCEGSGVNNDGLLWDGNMRYSCLQVGGSRALLAARALQTLLLASNRFTTVPNKQYFAGWRLCRRSCSRITMDCTPCSPAPKLHPTSFRPRRTTSLAIIMI